MTDYKLNQLVNLEQLRQLLETHHRLSGMAYGLFDAHENNLLAVGWQKICSQFHRINPVSCARCRESDAIIKAHLHDFRDIPFEYRCKNNMIDVAMPVIIDGHHLATVFTGQFFYDDDPPDRNFFAAQADTLGFNKTEYLQALAEAPVFSRDHIRNHIQLLCQMVKMLAETGLNNLKLESAIRKLEFLDHHDALTALPNRILLRDRFEQATTFAKREQLEIAVLILNLDNFKQVNDSLGHGCGDQLLVNAVERLQACIRDTDTLSRQGGDEFVILLTNIRSPGIIETVAQSIIDAFAAPFNLDGHAVNVSLSIGISVFPNDGNDLDTQLRQADIALLQAKEAGRNTYRFFSRTMNTDALSHIQLQGQLRNALTNDEFLLHYQPQIHTASGRIIGAEALVRWRHPELGLVPPGKFIPLAERSGLIIPLGEWVLNEACRQAQIWQKKHRLPPLLIAVNLSALQFKRGNIVETVRDALARSGLPAAQLELELTESILLNDVEEVMKTLRSLKEIGVKLSIDDFGTGYSSLAYLKRLTVDKLKIDQSFVRDMTINAEDAAIVKAINQLGHTLKLTTIAEGVETDAQLALLRNFGCDEIQGYLFSRPLAGEEFAAFYARHGAEACAE